MCGLVNTANVQVYLVSAFALFSAPQFCANNFNLGKLNMLYVLAVAHVAMVRQHPHDCGI